MDWVFDGWGVGACVLESEVRTVPLIHMASVELRSQGLLHSPLVPRA